MNVITDEFYFIFEEHLSEKKNDRIYFFSSGKGNEMFFSVLYALGF
jgi:hypothetical protein